MMNIFTDIFNRKSEVANPKSGLYHYARETGHEKSRIHLRVDADGHGTLIVNANSVMHLNPTATFMAWLILEGKTTEESVRALRPQYAVTRQEGIIQVGIRLRKSLQSTPLEARLPKSGILRWKLGERI